MLRLKKVSFSYEYDGETFCIDTSSTVISDSLKLHIDTLGEVFTANIISQNEIKILALSAVFEHDYSDQDRIFLNGYQSWTDSIEYPLNGKMHGLDIIPAKVVEKYSFNRYGDYDFTDYGGEGQLHGWSYGYVRTRKYFCFLGSLNENAAFTKISTDTNKNTITLTRDCSGIVFSGDYVGFRMLITDGRENEVFDRYFQLLGTKIRDDAKPVYGYTSWYRHYQKINENIIQNDLSGMLSQRFRPDVFQIDDGYQSAVGDWLAVDENKFPNGMKSIAESISSNGIIPGIWLAPFACGENSYVFRNFKEWFLTDEDGNYIKGGSNWGGFYILDIYNEDVRNYLRNVFDTIVNNWGFRLMKLDFLYAECIVPRLNKTRGQIMAEAMDFLRECAGDAFILGCGVPLASAFGKVDYCRIGCDVSLDWNDKSYMRLMHRERISTRNSILNSVFRRQLNGRAFYNDPDVFILRNNDTSLTPKQKKCLSEVNAMTGGVLFCSDDISEYSKEQLIQLSGVMKLRNANITFVELEEDKLKVTFKLGEKEYHAVYGNFKKNKKSP